MDKAVHVGNFCKNRQSTWHCGGYIGLRSVKVRTLDQSVLVVPNGALAQMQFENFGPCRKCLINQHFSLRIETQVEQLKILCSIESRTCSINNLRSDTGIEDSSSEFRWGCFRVGVGGRIVKTGDWAEFTTIRQDDIEDS